MSELYKTLLKLCEQRGISGYKMCRDIGMQPSVMTDLKMGRRASVKAETAQKIASYFGVSVGYLLGSEQKEKAPTLPGERKSETLSPAFFRLKKGLEPYNLSESDAEFLVEVYKAHIKKNQQE